MGCWTEREGKDRVMVRNYRLLAGGVRVENENTRCSERKDDFESEGV